MGWDFSIEYKKGKDNAVADTLSRQQQGDSLAAISHVTFQLLMEAKDSCKTDPKLQKIVDKVRLHKGSYKHYTFDGIILRKKGKVVIGADPNIKRRILHHFHNTMMGDHLGDDLTCRDQFYWKGLQKEVKTWVRECMICQKKTSRYYKCLHGYYNHSILDRTWKSISVGFVVGLPKSNGMTIIFVVCDRFMKYAHFTPLVHPFGAAKVGQGFFFFLFFLIRLLNCMVGHLR